MHRPPMASPHILLTGFEPFGGEHVNPSWQVAQALHGSVIDSLPVRALQLPCVFGAAPAALATALRQRPVLVLCLGQAGGRRGFSLERVAINVDDARIPDNRGQQPIDLPVVLGGAAAHFSSLPIKAIVAALQHAGWPAEVSQTAGTYVCNHVFYALMQALRRRRGVRGGFMHLPLTPDQAGAAAGQPSLPLAVQIDGVRVALQTALSTRVDLRITGGAVS